MACGTVRRPAARHICSCLDAVITADLVVLLCARRTFRGHHVRSAICLGIWLSRSQSLVLLMGETMSLLDSRPIRTPHLDSHHDGKYGCTAIWYMPIV